MAVWMRVTCWGERYLSPGTLWYAQGHSASVTCVTHGTRPSLGSTPSVRPLLGRRVCEVADAMIKADFQA
jgi:hypothetical protein